MPRRCAQIFLAGLAAGALTAATAAAQTTIHVHPTAGSPATSGTALLNALAAITDNSASKAYVLQLDPGTYDVGTSELVMKPYVDIEGSGQVSTTITGQGTDSLSGEEIYDSSYSTGIVQAAAPAELRNLRIVSQGSGWLSTIGVYVPAGSDVSLRDLTIVGGGAMENRGIQNIGASPTIQNVTIDLSGGDPSFVFTCIGIDTSLAGRPILRHIAIDLSCAALSNFGVNSDGIAAPREMRDLEISVVGGQVYDDEAEGIFVGADFGTNQTFLLTGSRVKAAGAASNDAIVFSGNHGSTFNVKSSSLSSSGGQSWAILAFDSAGLSLNHCQVTGTTNSLYTDGTPIDAGASRLSGPVFGPAITCSGAYNASYVPLNASCL